MKILNDQQMVERVCKKCGAWDLLNNRCRNNLSICYLHVEAQARVSMAEGKVEGLKKALAHTEYGSMEWSDINRDLEAAVAELEKLG